MRASLPKHWNDAMPPKCSNRLLRTTVLNGNSKPWLKGSYFFLAESGGHFVTIGTKSILYGAHCFFLHPLAVAVAWIRLFGFPSDPRIWIAFCVHDFGYWGCHDLDGAEGEQHVRLGSTLLGRLFDKASNPTISGAISRTCDRLWGHQPEDLCWEHFCLFHSRSFAKRSGQPVSRLCAADKLAFAVTPSRLYLVMVTLTGEVREYLETARQRRAKKLGQAEITYRDRGGWHRSLRIELLRWVAQYSRGLGNGGASLRDRGVEQSCHPAAIGVGSTLSPPGDQH